MLTTTSQLLQLKELLYIHVKATHKNEDYTPRYLMTEELDSEEPALHMFETYVVFPPFGPFPSP